MSHDNTDAADECEARFCPFRDLRDQLGNWLSRAPAAFRRAPKTALTLALVFLVAFAALFTATVLEFA
jgi:hypothetical protein